MRALQAQQARLRRDEQRLAREEQKARDQQRVDALQADAEQRTTAVQMRVAELEEVLRDGLYRESITFASLTDELTSPPFDAGGLDVPEPSPEWQEPPPPSRRERLLGGSRFRQEREDLVREFERQRADHAARDRARRQELGRRHRAHQRAVDDRVRQHRSAVRRLEEGYEAGEPAAVAEFVTEVLKRSEYPQGFPKRVPAVHFRPEAQHLAIEQELPHVTVVPEDKEYRLVKSRGAVVATPRPAREIADRYRQLTCQIALRTLHDTFAADAAGIIETVSFDGRVSTINRATGRPDRPRLVSLQTSREQFDELVLEHVDPPLCLKELGARVSPHPHDFEPVEPFFDFEELVARLKLTESGDLLASLDSRPDLLDLSPWDFETFVKQLFERMGRDRGWKAWKTRDVGDDGVDAVITSDDPVFRGKCIVQAKRYRKAVPPAAIRELIGSMHNTEAAKGILVTTSWVGPAGIQEAKRHGRIEIFDYENLKFLCKKYLGLDVLIGLPRVPRRSSGTLTGE